ncbi:MAG: hypothetical protein Q4B73_07735 [Lachnospiraceae bacterium]|nr:hypothetical protein [Lachnospiraceae bacterium]
MSNARPVTIKTGISARFIAGVILTFIGGVFTFLTIAIGAIFKLKHVSAAPFLVIFSIIGILLLVAGIVLLVDSHRKKKALEAVVANGILRYGSNPHVFTDSSMTINGQHPYVVECDCFAENGSLLRVRSRNLVTDPTPYLEGRPIPVYFDPQNADLYYVDIDSLLPNRD